MSLIWTKITNYIVQVVYHFIKSNTRKTHVEIHTHLIKTHDPHRSAMQQCIVQLPRVVCL